MFKIAKSIVFFPGGFLLTLGVLLGMWIAARAARKNSERGARYFLHLAALLKLLSRHRNQHNIGFFTMQALLLRRAPWEEVRPWADLGRAQPLATEIAFGFYFAQENYEQAHAAALDGCRATESAIEDKEAMARFFARYGKASSLSARGQIKKELLQEEAAPLAGGRRAKRFKPWASTPATRRARTYLDYYDAHLALETVLWVREINLSGEPRAKARIRDAVRGEYVTIFWDCPDFS